MEFRENTWRESFAEEEREAAVADAAATEAARRADLFMVGSVWLPRKCWMNFLGKLGEEREN